MACGNRSGSQHPERLEWEYLADPTSPPSPAVSSPQLCSEHIQPLLFFVTLPFDCGEQSATTALYTSQSITARGDTRSWGQCRCKLLFLSLDQCIQGSQRILHTHTYTHTHTQVHTPISVCLIASHEKSNKPSECHKPRRHSKKGQLCREAGLWSSWLRSKTIS